MALQTVNVSEGAFDPATQQPKWFVAIVYDDVANRNGTFNIDHFEYQNLASSNVYLMIHDKQGNLVESTPGSGYTQLIAPGTQRTTYPAAPNYDLAPDGSINGWNIGAQGPGR